MEKRKILFYLAYGIFMISSVLELTSWSMDLSGNPTIFAQILKYIRYIAYLLCILKISTKKFRKKEDIILLIFSYIILIAGYLGSLNKTMVLYMLIIIAAEDIESEDVIKISLLIQSIILSAVVFLSQIGIIEDYIRDPDIRPRHFLGFIWTSMGPYLYFFIVLEIIYLKKEKISKLQYLIMFVMGYWFYAMTDSKMAFFLITLILLFFSVLNKQIRQGFFLKKIKKISYFIPFSIAVFAIMIHLLYTENNKLIKKINDVLSGRLQLGYQAIKEYGIKLFGQPIEWIGYSRMEELKGTYNYVDSSFVRLLLEFGLLFLILVIIAYGLILKRSIDNKDFYLGWIVIFVLIFNITEPRLVNLTFNPFILLSFARINSSE